MAGLVVTARHIDVCSEQTDVLQAHAGYSTSARQYWSKARRTSVATSRSRARSDSARTAVSWSAIRPRAARVPNGGKVWRNPTINIPRD